MELRLIVRHLLSIYCATAIYTTLLQVYRYADFCFDWETCSRRVVQLLFHCNICRRGLVWWHLYNQSHIQLATSTCYKWSIDAFLSFSYLQQYMLQLIIRILKVCWKTSTLLIRWPLEERCIAGHLCRAEHINAMGPSALIHTYWKIRSQIRCKVLYTGLYCIIIYYQIRDKP